MSEEQMLTHQKFQPLAVLTGEPYPPRNCRDHGSSLLGMSPSGAFADIMKKHRQQQQFRLTDLCSDSTGERHNPLKLAVQHLFRLFDGKKSMYINCIDMVQVMLY